MTRRNQAPEEPPTHVVLDNEALGQITAGRPSRHLLKALLAAKATTGEVVLPMSVVVERNHDRTALKAAPATRILRDALADPLNESRAEEAVSLRARSGESGSVVDAHVAAAAHAVVRRFGGTATVATSDTDDLARLLGGSENPLVRASVGVLRLYPALSQGTAAGPRWPR